MPESKSFARRYALEEEIARGPLTIVYRARDEVLARSVAIKVVRSDVKHEDDVLEALRARTIAAAGLAHPNIAATYDTGEAGGSYFVVYEFCPRGTLQDLLGRPMPFDRVIEIGLELCDALAYAHAAGIIHGDLHPRNVLISDDDTIKITDFGHWRGDAHDRDADVEPFLAPERGVGVPDDPRLDVYSTGALLYAATTGRAPVMRDERVPPHPRSLRADIPRSIDSAIARALAAKPHSRHPDMGALHAELAAARPPMPARARRAPVAATPARSAVDFRWLGPVVGLIAVAIVLSLTLPRILGGDEPGTRARNGEPGGRSGLGAIAASSADDFDPYGDGQEHPEDVSAAIDGESSTYWTTENYSAPLELQGKPGVGLVFDLESSQQLERIEIEGAQGCDIEIRAADELGPDENSFQLVTSVEDLSSEEVTFEATEGRYWLVWITNLAGDGSGSAQVYEVRFFGS